MKNYANLQKLQPFLNMLKRGQPALMLALGDSNTDNFQFTNGYKQWPELLHTKLKQTYNTHKLLLLNAGVSGNTIEDALGRFETDIARFRPDLTVVCLGSNDANRLTDRAFRAGMDDCLDRLAELGSLVLLRTPAPVWQKDKGFNRIWPDDAKLRRKIAVIRDLARRRALPFVDVYQIWRDEEKAGKLDLHDLMTDCVHTNGAGHRRVAEHLYPAFKIPVK